MKKTISYPMSFMPFATNAYFKHPKSMHPKTSWILVKCSDHIYVSNSFDSVLVNITMIIIPCIKACREDFRMLNFIVNVSRSTQWWINRSGRSFDTICNIFFNELVCVISWETVVLKLYLQTYIWGKGERDIVHFTDSIGGMQCAYRQKLSLKLV